MNISPKVTPSFFLFSQEIWNSEFPELDDITLKGRVQKKKSMEISIREHPSMTPSRGANHWYGEI